MEIISNLTEDEVYLERDWAMKFLPMVYRYVIDLDFSYMEQ
jgi:hypothetical protein